MKQLVFKEGDRVYFHVYGWGKIFDIDVNVGVKFESLDSYIYFNQGFLKALSFTEYTLEGFSQERPEELPELGDVVWVRDKDSDEWEVSHFYKKDHLGYHVSNDMISYHVAIWSQLRKTNPYKNEETEA
jgi:hypothetical protein